MGCRAIRDAVSRSDPRRAQPVPAGQSARRPFWRGAVALAGAVTPPFDAAAVRRWRSINCWVGRPYGPPIAFGVHTAAGGESGTVAELLSGPAQPSAHDRVC